MDRKLLLIAGLLVVLSLFAGCQTAPGESTWYRAKRHMELHLLAPYNDLVELHREVDWFFFDIDDDNPDLY